MASIGDILKSINLAVEEITGASVRKQAQLLQQVFLYIKDLQTRGDDLVNNSENYKKINQVQTKLQRFIVDEKYKANVVKFAKAYQEIGGLNNKYFIETSPNYKLNETAKKINEQLTKNAISTTVSNLTEAGIRLSITDRVRDILNRNVTAGGSYAALTEELRTLLTKANPQGMGPLERFVKTYATTAINQFSAEYNKNIASDLGLHWYRYTGSLIETSREFCVVCVDKDYVHESEFNTLLKGDINGEQIELNKKTGLPNGLMEGTNEDNFPRRRGGWNCRHQLIAVSDEIVPENIKKKVYATDEYKTWLLAQLQIPQPVPAAPPIPVTPPPVPAPPPPVAPPAAKKPLKDWPPPSASKEKVEIVADSRNKDIIKNTTKMKVSGQIDYGRNSKEDIIRKTDQVERLFNDYKIDSTGTIILKYASTADSYGAVASYPNQKVIHSINFGDNSDTNRSSSQNFKSKVDGANTDLATVTHETTHIIWRSRMKMGPDQKKFHKDLKKLEDDYFSEIKKNPSISLGRYAETNIDEFMAEAFTEYKLNSNPSKYALLVGELIDKYFKR